MGRHIAYLANRKCDIVGDLSCYDQMSSEDLDTQFHIESVNKNKGRARTYSDIMGSITDSHIEIEKLGVCNYHRKYSVIISMEDSLDYLLHRLSGSSIESVRNMPNYKNVSRALMKLNYSALEDDFGSLRECDPKVDEFFSKIFVESAGDSIEQKSAEFQKQFVISLWSELKKVLEYTALTYYFANEGNLVLRSKSLCSFVMTSNTKMEDKLTLRSKGHDDYTIFVRSFERNEYLEKIDLEYA